MKYDRYAFSLFSPEDIALLKSGGVPRPSKQPWIDDGVPLILFGCGGTGRWIAITIIREGGQILGFFDNNPQLWGEVQLQHVGKTLPVYNPETYGSLMDQGCIPEKHRVLLVVSPLNAQIEIAEQCERLGIDLELYHQESAPDLEAVKSGEAEQVLAMLADDRSRHVYRTLIRKRTGLDSQVPIPAEPEQYFSCFVPIGYYRSFADVGALNGDTFREFIKRFGSEFDRYYAIEPNPNNLAMFTPKPAEWPQLRLFPVAASDSAGTAFLSDFHSTSQLGGDRGIPVETARLDDILAGQRVTFIKMDVEGWEIEALYGAEGIIRDQKPAVAISVYHKLRHFWEVPLLLRKYNPSYSLYVRHHSRFFTETVCYAVP